MTTISVYQSVGSREEVSNYGDTHDVTVYVVKHLTPTGQKRDYDNGYTVEATPLFRDHQGRLYHCHPPVDFYGGSYYRRDTDGATFASRTSRHARDLAGRPIGDVTPPLPADDDGAWTPTPQAFTRQQQRFTSTVSN